MKQILVPTDFSNAAENAINFALQSAKILPAEVTLVHSFEVNDSAYADYVGVNREFNRSMITDAKEKLDAIKKRIENTDGIVVKTFVSTENLIDTVINFRNENKVDLVVMGTLGASGLKEKLWGSRTSAVIGKTAVPVMVIPNEYKWKKPEKMLLATNQFEEEAKNLNFLFELAGLYMASMQVAVFTDEDDDKTQVFLDNQKRIADYETFLKANYKEDTLSSAHLSGESFNETLQSFIKENDIDILVMITYQSSFWSRLFNPSKTKRMSYHTTIPLLAIPVNKNGTK
ncbi:MAG: universal stress protein [Ginsengibacter sp.]|jgi:nucleotide-binding universal stress UspA family protein